MNKILLISIVVFLVCVTTVETANTRRRREKPQGTTFWGDAASADGTDGTKLLPSVWPAPQNASFETEPSRVLRTVNLVQFDLDYPAADYGAYISHLLDQAGSRFFAALTQAIPRHGADRFPVNPNHQTIWQIQGIHITIHNTHDYNNELKHGVDESYHLQVRPPIDNDDYIILEAQTVWGILHGLSTLWQLLPFGWLDDRSNHAPVFTLTGAPFDIRDAPAYPYRGLLIDTSRHYLPLPLILQNLNAMAMNKLNVLHWHVVDSQSWPYQSLTFPELSAKGAYCADCIYTAGQVTQVIHEAALRGIRVVPEFDLPGHSQAIGASHPELLTACGDDRGPSEPLDVTQDQVYPFVYALYQEINATFPSDWIHIGGDEVNLDCWKNNPDIQRWKQLHNMTQEEQVLQYFETKLVGFINKEIGKRPIVWQELFDSGLSIPQNVVVDVWQSWRYNQTLSEATAKGYTVLVSYCWYLDHLDMDVGRLYQCNPTDFTGSKDQKALVDGGHASMWGERVDETIFFPRVWPRASAVAEKLWTGEDQKARATWMDRLDHFHCLMIEQGIPASPLRPGSCISSVSGTAAVET